MAGSAISTTGRRRTTRPCNLSRGGTQPASLRRALPYLRDSVVKGDWPTGHLLIVLGSYDAAL